MARNENPPWGRGETFYNLFSATTQSTSDGVQFEGKEWLFEDISPTTKVYRTGQFVRCRAVRNVSGIALLPSRVAKFALVGQGAAPIGAPSGYFGGEVDGYTYVAPVAASLANNNSSRGFPIDEYLPTAGAQNLDLFWIVVGGPASCLTDLATLSPGIACGDLVVSQTAATSQATTAGRVIDVQANTSDTTHVIANALCYIGYAMSGTALSGATTSSGSTAATANNTNTNLLVDVIYH